MVKKSGEPRVIANSLFLLTAGLAPIPFIHGSGVIAWGLLLVVLAVLSIGSMLTRPPVFGLISILTPAHEQGATIGVAQSAGSLARIIAPIFAASLLDYHPALPYLICSGVALVTGMLAWQSLCKVEPGVLAAKAESAG